MEIAYKKKLLEFQSIDFEFFIISILILLCFYLFSELFAYLTCLLVPAYFTFRSLKEKTHENVQRKLMKYWVCYAILSYPLKLLTEMIFANEMIGNLIKILFFSNLYHPRSQLLDTLLRPLHSLFIRYDSYFRKFSNSFFQGFEDGISKN